MTLLVNTINCAVLLSSFPRFILPFMCSTPLNFSSARRFSSHTKFTSSGELDSYLKLRDSSDAAKIKQITARYELSATGLQHKKQFSSNDYFLLLDKIEAVSKASIQVVASQEERRSDAFVHFENRRTFINFPYSEHTSKWPDRQALQNLIREKFCSIFQSGDLVIVPGCADGQIPIEIYGNALKHQKKLNIVAVDLNVAAMRLGYHVMNSYGLNPQNIKWVQADATAKTFFSWLEDNNLRQVRHQVVTLLQPCLTESQFLSILQSSRKLSHLAGKVTTIVMTVLLEDHNTPWYQACDGYVKQALHAALKDNTIPVLTWRATKYGRELLRLNADKKNYVPEQYFIRSESLPEIRRIVQFNDVSRNLFSSLIDPTVYGHSNDPRIINNNQSQRIFCIWESS